MRTCVFDVLPATVGHFMCKIVDIQLVYDFSELNWGPKPCTRYFLLYFSTYPYIYARVGNLQPFARIHISWTVFIYNLCFPRSDGGVLEYVLSWQCLQTHTHINNFNNHSHSGLYYITYTKWWLKSFRHIQSEIQKDKYMYKHNRRAFCNFFVVALLTFMWNIHNHFIAHRYK